MTTEERIQKKHGLSNTALYRIWKNMIMRCYSPKYWAYKHYGGKGIKVCDRWRENFEDFYNDLNSTYRTGLTIERIDGSGDYTPENVRWATTKEQAINRSTTRFVDYNGQKVVLHNLCEEHGVLIDTVVYRLNNGVPIEIALSKTRLKRKTKIIEQNKKV